jgi:Raf kinase inhibitor-like YbhB/YbcL family protein
MSGSMRVSRAILVAALFAFSHDAIAQRGGGGRGGRGGGRGAVVMTLTSSAFENGGQIPVKYSQPGAELSPPLAWTGAPDSASSFVLIIHDANAPAAGGVDDVLHWMVWNIPGTARTLPEGIPHGPQTSDGLRQISVSGPYYRGPAAPATGPVHNYVFELYALDTIVDIQPVGAPPAATRTAMLAAMAGHVRGKGALVGWFRRSAP